MIPTQHLCYNLAHNVPVALTPKKFNVQKNSASTSSPMSANSTNGSKRTHPSVATVVTTMVAIVRILMVDTEATDSKHPIHPQHPRQHHQACPEPPVLLTTARSMRNTTAARIHMQRTADIRIIWRTTSNIINNSSRLRQELHQGHQAKSLRHHLLRVGVHQLMEDTTPYVRTLIW